MSPISLLVVLLVCAASADQESCQGRCTEGFNSKKKCQCDELCSYYKSCCIDYAEVCKLKVTRGDVFDLPEDEYPFYDPDLGTTTRVTDTSSTTTSSSVQVTTQDSFQHMGQEVTQNTDFNPDSILDTTFSVPTITLEEEEVCSGKPFDAFTDLKNGSLFAFRGKYCYELDEKSVLPGYPKLIRDVWGIEGPIDAAFTRINCQGKTYLFKGSLYWRFEDGILDSGYPRNISDGFKNIPDDIDAAVALPAHSYSGRERAYFFKGKQFWEYEFKQQPNQEECEGSELSTVFEHFAILQQYSWQSIFELLFWNSESDLQQGASGPWFISQDWHGVPDRVDAAMAGRIYLSSSSTPRSNWAKKHKAKAKARQRNRKRYRSRKSRLRHSRRSRDLWSLFSSEEDGVDYDLELSLDWFQPSNCEPIQSIYFFVGDKYYRVNLRTKKVDFVDPPYPRPIAPYWLGCPPLRALK
ncbi:vitronectin isoform X1 [Gracilinanus agilis]|uniref:vitronectin isoform X1 n=1 Tax=Gracilinanus agilis TaxID=191870 RepID=UPI001CFDECFA|nr:vitronectin isoform X1 [Gracilinanus agilis]